VVMHPEEAASKALTALANAYGHYNILKLATRTETAPGKSAVTVNLTYFSQILDDLGRHAGRFPVQFQFPDDRQRAEEDVSRISDLLDPVAQNNAPLQLRMGLLHAIGFNLDVPGSYAKAVAAFTTLLAVTPNDAGANYEYGAFLAATTRKGEAIPFLEKAKDLGAANAEYWLGWSYEVIGEKKKAIDNLESYTKRVPGDLNAARVLDAIRHDKVKMEDRKSIPP
jgi:tetratricopeptide (TPR) repeat protein